MKKLIMGMGLFLLSIALVSAWDVQRTILGDVVTLTITPTDGFDTFILTETLSDGVTVVEKSFKPLKDCGISNVEKTLLKCDFGGVDKGDVTYKVSGTGLIKGKVVATRSDDFKTEEKTISGIAEVTGGVAKECSADSDCAGKVLGASSVGCKAGTCAATGCQSGFTISNGVCTKDKVDSGATTVGAEVDKALDAANIDKAKGKPWTAKMLSVIANVFKSWFG